MTMFPSKAGVVYRAQAKLKSLLGYQSYLVDCRKRAKQTVNSDRDQEISSLLSGYPRNHNYEVHQGVLIPSFRLYERFRLVRQSFPSPLESLLDIGCCRGFYVNSGALDPSCQKAVGIDVHQPFLDLAGKVSDHLQLTNTSFHLATLDQVVADPQKYGAPFETIILIGTYHYLFWGGEMNAHCFGDHNTILEALSKLCSKRIIFSGRLEVDRLPKYNRVRAEGTEKASQFTTANFVSCAEKYFHVKCNGFLGSYPLLQLDKK